MKRTIAILALACAACANGTPGYVVRHDLQQIAAEKSQRDTGPGFTALPRADGAATGGPPQKIV